MPETGYCTNLGSGIVLIRPELHPASVHPPLFALTHHLSDWPECRLELHCPEQSGRMVDMPVRLLLSQCGDQSFGAVLAKLRCRCCGKPPLPVYLVAGLMRRPDLGGGGPCWTVQLP